MPNRDALHGQVVRGTIIERSVMPPEPGIDEEPAFSVDVGPGERAFLPLSQVDVRPVRDPDLYLARELEFFVVYVAPDHLVLSRRVLLERERATMRAETLATVRMGSVVSGKVVDLTEYAAFIDIGGVDALLQRDDMRHGSAPAPIEFFSIGQELRVQILEVTARAESVRVGLKQLTADPWSTIVERFPVGARVTVRVSSVLSYGAAVELEPGIEGFVHVSELGRRKVAVGDALEVRVVQVDDEGRRVELAS